MKGRSILFLVAFALIFAAGVVLRASKESRKWGRPGVKVAEGVLRLPDGQVVATNVVQLPSSLSDYESQERPMQRTEVDGLPPDTTFGRRYYRKSDAFETLLSVVLMGSDRTSLHPPQYCIQGQGCTIEKIEEVRIPIEKPFHYDLPVSKVIINRPIEKDGRKFVVSGVYLYWYVSDNSIRASYSSGVSTMLKSLIHNQPMERWAYISCLSLCRPGDEEKAFEELKRFVAASVPQFQSTAGLPVSLTSSIQ